MLRNTLFILSLIFCVPVKYVCAQPDTTFKKILKLNLTAYKGHSVDSLVKALPVNYSKMTILSNHGGYGNLLCIFYANSVNVGITVRTFKYFNPHLDFTKPLKGQWDANMSLFKKEVMAYAIVYQGNICYAGCENDKKSQLERKIKP